MIPAYCSQCLLRRLWSGMVACLSWRTRRAELLLTLQTNRKQIAVREGERMPQSHGQEVQISDYNLGCPSPGWVWREKLEAVPICIMTPHLSLWFWFITILGFNQKRQVELFLNREWQTAFRKGKQTSLAQSLKKTIFKTTKKYT